MKENATWMNATTTDDGIDMTIGHDGFVDEDE